MAVGGGEYGEPFQGGDENNTLTNIFLHFELS